jgi:hypothetical protein
VTTAARRGGTITADNRADFDRLVAALPFDPMHPPETGGEGLVKHLARVFALDAVTRAHAEGRKVDEAVIGLGSLVREAHEELNQQRRAAHLAAARTIADGRVPSVNAKAVAAYATARDRADFLDAMGNLNPRLAADKRAAEAMNDEPVTTAALILTYGAILRAHESVRQAVRLRPSREGQPSAEAVVRVVARSSGGHSWIHGKGEEDRRYLVRIEHLAREWADSVLVPALRDRLGAS